jgi:glutamate racemase
MSAEAPSTWVEEEFGRVLGVAAAPHDDFFALGGTSLSAAKLAMRLSARSGRAVSIADVLRGRTPGALATRIMQANELRAEPDATAVTGEARLARSQRWYGWTYRGDALDRAVVCFPIELPDGTDAAGVRAALITMVRRHDALRMGLTVTDDDLTPHLLTTDQVASLLSGGDGPGLLRVMETDARGEQLAQVVAQTHMREHARGLVVGDHPLFRAVLVRGAGPDGRRPCRLVFTAHHLIFDGASATIFEREIRAACRNPDGLPGSPASYHQFAMEPDEPAGGAAERWWRGYLSGFEGRCHLARRHAGDDPPTWVTGRTVPEDSMASLVLRAKESRVPISTLRLAGLLVLVHALCDTSDAVVCMPVDERTWVFENTIGMMIDCVPLRHRARAGESLRELIDTLSTDLPQVMEHRKLGFDRIARGTGADVEGKYPLTGVILNGGDQTDFPSRRDVPRSEPVSRPMLYDLQVYFLDSPDRVDVEIQYRSELFDPTEAERVLMAYEYVLSRLAESGADAVLDVAGEARRMLAIKIDGNQ